MFVAPISQFSVKDRLFLKKHFIWLKQNRFGMKMKMSLITGVVMVFPTMLYALTRVFNICVFLTTKKISLSLIHFAFNLANYKPCKY